MIRLLTFLQDTKKYMKQHSNIIKDKDIEPLKRIAHKMLPMFRQLDVYEAIPLLEKMEHIGEGEKTHEIQKDFKRQIYIPC